MPTKEENLFLIDHSYGPIKKHHDPVYQLKTQQGEIREKGGIGIQLKKGNYIEENYGTQAMNKPIERRLVFQEVLKFIIFTCSIPVLLIQGVNNTIQQINLYPIDCTVCFIKIHLQDSDLSLGKHFPSLGQLHWLVLDLKVGY